MCRRRECSWITCWLAYLVNYQTRLMPPTCINWYFSQVFICCSLVHPTPLSPSSSSMSLSINSPQSPRCSTPLFSKQRRTRPFIACELCRQRAFQSINEHEDKTKVSQVKTTHEKQPHHHSTTLHYYQYPTNNISRSIRRRRDRRRSSMDQLLVWILWNTLSCCFSWTVMITDQSIHVEFCSPCFLCINR